MLKLVLISAICLSFPLIEAKDNADVTKKLDVIKNEASSSFTYNSEFPTDTHFHCNKRLPGYYADPRFNCEVFHFCHQDGTRVTIPCSQGNRKHKICFLRDIASRACDGSELYLALPEELFFKGSKDTTASALNGATEYKLPEVLPGPTEDRVSTTPLSSEEEGTAEKSDSQDISSIYEVFNSFLKEIEGGQQLESKSNTSEPAGLKPRPSTFSRGSRFPSSLEQKDTLIDILPSIERRIDKDGPFLVEVYNNNDGDSSDSDYSSYRRKSKKLFFTSDKKTPAKHPRRRKRTIGEQLHVRRPYAVIYAKVPDLSSPVRGFDNVPNVAQDRTQLSFEQSFSPGDVPLVPVTIETRRKKSKSKKKTPPSEDQQTNQQTSEQQNIYFYAPDQVNGPGQDGRTRIDPRQRVPDNRDQRQRPQQLTVNTQQGQQPQNVGRPPYSPQVVNPLQLPNFPFQPQSFSNGPRQPPYYFGSQDGFSPFGPPFGPPEQFQPPSQQGQRPPVHTQPTRGREPNHRPVGRPENEDAIKEDAAERPPSSPGPQGYQRFQNPFFDSFSGFGGAPFGGPFTPQRDPATFSLLPPAQVQQPTHLLNPQQPSEQHADQGRPQPPLSLNRPETFRPGIQLQSNQDPRQYGQGVPQQDRTRHPSEHAELSPNSPPQRPPRNRGRPTSTAELSPSYSPNRPQENLQLLPQRQPPGNTIASNQNRQRPQQYTPYEQLIGYQPQHSPEVVLRPEKPPTVPLRDGIPNEEQQGISRPVVLLEDLTQQNIPRPQDQDKDQRNVVYSQRQPAPERIQDERQRQPEQERRPHDRRPTRPQQQQSSRYISPTPPPPTRARERTRQPTRPERQRQRTRPVGDSEVPNIVDELQDYGHRTSPPPDERPIRVRTRPENTEVANRHNRIPPPQRRPSSEVNDGYGLQNTRPRHRGSPRERPREGSQPQIERPPSEYVPSQPEIYSGPQEYYTYPPEGNDINVISTVEDPENRPHTPPSVIRNHLPPGHRQTVSNFRNSDNGRNQGLEVGFIPMTDKPYRESYYQTRPPTNEHTDTIEDFRALDKIHRNRYQGTNEAPPTTREASTTRRTTQKPRPPPPKPTFPTFPTFPPPPRRPVTSPRPRTESTEFRKEIDETSDLVTNDPDHLGSPVSRSKPHLETLGDTESFRSKELAPGDSLITDSPEVTTRRRTRKRKPRPRRPKPTTSYSEEGQTQGDIITQPTTEREVISRSTSGRSNNRWQKQTTSQPRKASTSPSEEVTTMASGKAEEFGSRINLFGRQRPRKPTALKSRVPSTTQSSQFLREESMKVSRVPSNSRSRKPFTNRHRSKTTTTTTEYPETEGPIARSDENAEFLYYQSDDTTTHFNSLPEYDSVTQLPTETTTEFLFTTESYNEMVETTSEITTAGYEGGTDTPLESNEKMDDFESTRSVLKKFQNRPRILKFGKPKLRSTISPIDLNLAESRTV